MSTDIQDVTANDAEPKEDKLFTQEEVDKIIDGRFGRMMDKFKDYDDLKAKAAKLDEIEEASKSELQKATERAMALQKELDDFKTAEKVRLMHEKVSKDTGVPANLLTGDSEEACKAQAKQILEFSRPSGYPQVRDGGEARTSGKKSTRDSFAEWFNNQ